MQQNETSLPGIDVLNTGHGDFELGFEPNKPDEFGKAKQTIANILKRCYAIFVPQAIVRELKTNRSFRREFERQETSSTLGEKLTNINENKFSRGH